MRFSAHARGALAVAPKDHRINTALAPTNLRRPRMGPAPAYPNRLPTSTVVIWKEHHGCGRRAVVVPAGAGPIRGRHAVGSLTPVLTARRTSDKGASRERGPENAGTAAALPLGLP